MDQIHDLVGEHRRAGTVTTVSTFLREHFSEGHAVGQACQAGLETRTHPGEAVPCRCCVCKVCRSASPAVLSGRFGNDGEYALTKSRRIPVRGKSCFDDGLRWQSSKCVSETFDRPMLYVWVAVLVVARGQA